MNQISIVGIDLAKHVFQLHAVDAQGHQVFSKTVGREQLRDDPGAVTAVSGGHGSLWRGALLGA